MLLELESAHHLTITSPQLFLNSEQIGSARRRHSTVRDLTCAGTHFTFLFTCTEGLAKSTPPRLCHSPFHFSLIPDRRRHQETSLHPHHNMPFSATITMKVNTSNAPKSPLLPLPSPPPQSQSPPSPSLWRFWKWAPPLGAGRPSSASGQTDDYGQLMASFKEHLTASPTFLYAINELR